MRSPRRDGAHDEVDLEVVALDGADHAEGSTPVVRSPSRRGWVVGAAVLAGLIGAGLLVDRSDDDASGAATTTAVRPGTSGSAPPTSASSPTALASARTDPGPVLAVLTGAELVVATANGPTVVVDLDDGHIEPLRRLGTTRRTSGPLQPLAAAQGDLLAEDEDGRLLLLRDNGAEVELPSGPLLVSPTGRTVWSYQRGLEARHGTVDLLPRLLPMALPAGATPVAGMDDALLVQAAGGIYTLGIDGTRRRISPGSFMGANGQTVASRECDESLRCSVVIRSLDTAAVIAAHPAPGLESVAGALSPDGRWLAVITFEPTARREVLVIDLASGAHRSADARGVRAMATMAPQWTRDGRYVLFGQGPRLVAFDTATTAFSEHDLSPLDPRGAIVLR